VFPACAPSLDATLKLFAQHELYHFDRFDSFSVIGQADRRWIIGTITSSDRRLVVSVDQHAADERVQLERQWTQLGWTKDGHDHIQVDSTSIDPCPLSLSQRELRMIGKYEDTFYEWGVEWKVEDDMVVVVGVPEIISGRLNAQPHLIRELVVEHLYALEEGRGLASGGNFLASCPKVLMDMMNSQACRSTFDS
jgi:DNA mismatch repair ATPase MutL